jgi:hypothetical protein
VTLSPLARARPGVAWLLMAVGGGLLLFGLLVRVRIFGPVPPVAAGIGLGIGASAILFRWPRVEPFLGFLLVLVVALGVALLVGGQVAPPLELSGGIGLQLGLLELALARRFDPSAELPGEVRVIRGGKVRNVTAAEIVTGDRIEVGDGERIPVDGRIEKGQGFIDEAAVSGSGLPVSKREGDRVYAGTLSAMPELVVVAERPAIESLLKLKARAADALDQALLELHPGRLLWAGPTLLLALGAAFWWIGHSARWPARLEGVAALLLGIGPFWAGLSVLLTRLEARREVYAQGLVVTRKKDLAQLARIRRWQLEPQLLVGGGGAETVEWADIPGETLLAVAHALLSEVDGPERQVLKRSLEKRRLEALSAAALKEKGGVRHGTINGRRWYLGVASAVLAEEGKAPDGPLRGTLDFLAERSQLVWLIGRADQGLVGALGLNFELDPDVVRAARGLSARLLGGLPDHLRQALATKAELQCDGPPCGPRDAALLSEQGPAPSAGLRLRVVELSAEPLLKLEAAPRIFRPAVGALPNVQVGLRTIQLRLFRRLAVAIFGAALAAALILVAKGVAAVGVILGALLAIFALLV